ncbi:MAG: hypothetical protein JW965_10480 [Bacteroidales bacterium]|nr:hypothetical protein [Bacteroidales bacterium]
MEKNNNHDRFFRELLSDSSREMPFSDFEDEVMAEIRMEYEKKFSGRRNIRLSWLFFILGMLSGIATVFVMSFYSANQPFAFISDNLLPVGIVFICLTIILFAEKLVKISFRRDNH